MKNRSIKQLCCRDFPQLCHLCSKPTPEKPTTPPWFPPIMLSMVENHPQNPTYARFIMLKTPDSADLISSTMDVSPPSFGCFRVFFVFLWLVSGVIRIISWAGI